MTWVAVVAILFSVAMLMGPIMFMRPTKSQARLARIRAHAQNLGCRVRMGQNPFASEKFPIAVYYLLWDEKYAKKMAGVELILFRKPYAHDIHFSDDWDWFKKSFLSPQIFQALKAMLQSFDDSIVGVEVNKLGASIYWLEKTIDKSDEKTVEDIVQKLKNLRALFQI